ncbi:hypothetical protein OSTOST_08613 [Ostertagia ostertagi]
MNNDNYMAIVCAILFCNDDDEKDKSLRGQLLDHLQEMYPLMATNTTNSLTMPTSGLSDAYSMLAFKRPENMLMGSVSLVHTCGKNEKWYPYGIVDAICNRKFYIIPHKPHPPACGCKKGFKRGTNGCRRRGIGCR